MPSVSRAESDVLLAALYAHITQPEFVYGHSWRPGDLLIIHSTSGYSPNVLEVRDAQNHPERNESERPGQVERFDH